MLPDLATGSEFGYFSCLILTKIWHWLLSVLATFLATFEKGEIVPKKYKFDKFLNLPYFCHQIQEKLL